MSKRAALLVAVALTLTACSSTPDKPTVAQGGEDFGKAFELSGGFGTTQKPGEFPRTVKHAMGETKLEKKPERVIVLDTGELDNVVALGIKPVGIAYTDGSPTMPSYIGDKGGTPENVGTTNNLNLEAITKLNPDLILGSQLRAEALYPKLAAIAPTVFSVRPGYVWKENFLLNAAALDRQADAAKMLEDYTKKATETGDAIEKKLGVRPTVTALRFMPGRIRLYAKKSFIGTILIDAKIGQPTSSQVDDLAAEVSAEQISKADGDFILYSTYGDPAKTAQASVLGGPLWTGLNAVKAGKAKPVLDETYFLGLGVLAADVVLDDMKKQLGV
ncbi:ABC transporter substrate-binding protein [Lentzea flaviverrucosa]|uniref:Iron complex transport system substrate-binding protein n=1 Tax=Lentzea flaviverrucosa TaxID=200379 RepID=A0A1H9RIU1_9PSEU|nr:iron-siderophore ABC transporter substrate-binding protein [Lentzea flaviverrucosa]RDI33031.1 iron complex transport system substrate-binding protein [Lentzea flaviverrucosa]SER72741.1 iron complex transport system substrate-binding protein [Lentzea flaviverrucosa]